jgi:parallel beta-helix repeat protein
MKEVKFLFAFFVSTVVVSSPCYADEWALTYGSGNGDFGYAIQQTADQGFVVAGGTHSFGASPYSDIWVVKLGPNGTMDWQKSYGGSEVDYTYCIRQTRDGGYILAGSSISFGGYNYDFWVLKLASDGAIAWQKTYGGGDDDHPTCIEETLDAGGNPDGYVIAGYTGSFGAVSYDVWVLRLNTDGSIGWQNTYGGSEYDTASSIQQTFDTGGNPDGYVLAGITHSFGAGNFDVWVLKLFANGTIDWQKTYGGSDDEGADSIRQTFDNGGNPDGYIVAGGAWGGSQYLGHVLRLHHDGSVSWQKGFDAWSFDTRYFVQQTADSGFILAGGDDQVSQSDIWIAKLDSNGDIVWQKIYGGGGQDDFGAIQQVADGGYVVAGVTTSFGVGSADLLGLKLDASGAIPNCSAIDDSNITYWDITPSVNGSTVVAEGTSATVSDTTVTPQDTWAEMSEVCAETAADFKGTPVVGINPLTVAFTDLSRSAGSPATWLWQFGDQETSDVQNPIHTYTTAGLFTVTLTVSGPNGSDTETKTDYIQAVEGQAYQAVWPDPTPGATPIQDAIDMAANHGVILVHNGTYYENINVSGRGITIQSESGPADTIIDGGNNGSVVIFEAGEGIEAVVLQGLTIRNGDPYGISCNMTYSGPTVTDCIITNNADRGMYCDEANPTITECTFSYNGGGLQCWASSPTITDCTFSHNSVDFYGGGVFLINGSSAEITNSVFSNNHGDLGGGICIHTDSHATITGCVFSNNTSKMGGGIDIALSDPHISNCTIVGNAATADSFYSGEGGGILVRWESNPTIDNCYISANSAEDGGGVYCENSNPTIANCTIRGNMANSNGGGIYCYDDYEADNGPTVVNAILWEDMAGGSPNEIYLGFGGFIDIAYSDVQGDWPGTGNSDCNPDFVDSSDYHLLGSSCCIDAGTGNGAPGEDMDGEARPCGNGYDMGADEFYPVHAGFVVLDRQAYAPGVVVNILVTDSDLDTDSNQREQYTNIVTIVTNHDQTPYDTESTITMLETGPATGVFKGTIPVAQASATPENEIVEIDCQTQETITATYHDADDGTGNPASPSDTADTDCVPPTITNIQVTHVGYTVATISWDTNEAADSRVNYGTGQALGATQQDPVLSTSHTIHLNGLVPDTPYYFEVVSTDEAGNQASENNLGQYYQFQTAVLAAQWATAYDASSNDTGYAIRETFDALGDPDGYIVAGITYPGSGDNNMWVLRLDLQGSVIWEKSYGGSNSDGAQAIQQTVDQTGTPDGYIVAGHYSHTYGWEYRDLWVIKLNLDGSIAWEKTWGGNGGEDAYAVQQTFDTSGRPDGYVVAGRTTSFGAGGYDAWVLKLSPAGSVVWQRTYGGSGSDGAMSIRQTINPSGQPDGYIATGYTDSFGADQWGDVWVFKLDSAGNVVWEKRYGGSGEDNGGTIEQTFNAQGEPDGYIVEADTSSFGSPGDAWVLRLNLAGDVAWQKTYGGTDWDWTHFIQQTEDRGYIVAGCAPSFSASNQDLWLLKLNADGTVAWQQTYCCRSSALSVQQTADNGLIATGWISLGSNQDLWVLKLDENGQIPGCGGNSSQPSVADTTVSGINTTATVNLFSVTPSSAGVSGQNTYAQILDTCIPPDAAFTANVTSGGAPLAVQFTDQTTGAVTSWSWDFNDDGIEDAAGENSLFAFAEAGDYTVSLTVTGPGGQDTEVKEDYIHVTEPAGAPIIDKIGGTKEPGKKIRIIGSGFGDPQGDSVVHLGNRTYDSSKLRIKLWSNTMIKIKLPNYGCTWFKGKDVRRVKVWVTVGGVDSNVKSIRVQKPDTCP